MENTELEPRVAVLGVGGAGCNVVSKVFDMMPSADAVAVNCDKEAMHNVKADVKHYICKSVTNGEGAKGDVSLGRECAKAHIDEIEKTMSGHDAIFIVAGMGGGTGTGAAPIIAERAQNMGLMTFVIAVNPFSFESGRTKAAKEGLAKLRQVCPNTIAVENDMVLESMPDASMRKAFNAVNASIASFIMKKTAFIKKCFESEFDSVSTEVLESRFNDSNAANIADSVGLRPKTAKE